MMSNSELLAKAISIASTAFEKTLDKGNNPYILHCLAVMDGVKHLGTEAMIVAVLHDLLEDTLWNRAELQLEGFPEELINLIEMLTRKKGEDYLTYVGRVSTNPITKAIKIADLTHNMRPDRLVDLTDKSMERMKKYHTAYKFLTNKD